MLSLHIRITNHDMQPFLKSIARAYTEKYGDLSDFLFLFPNKRSATFFRHYLAECASEHPVIAPELSSITDFVTDVSELIIDSRIDLLFRLYKIYLEMIVEEKGKEAAEGIDFYSFRAWGETALSDFSEIDMYYCDASAVFRNLKDLKEIATDFLTDEQRRVMEEYFGRIPESEVEHFWLNFEGDGEKLSEIKKRFLHLWEVMTPLYGKLTENLAAEGLCMTGQAYRTALDKIRSGDAVLPYKKIVCVGFNALSTTERLIFEALRDNDSQTGEKGDSFCDFFWDGTGPVLARDDNSSSTFLRVNRREFPSPEWAAPYMRESETSHLPRVIRIVASPSNAMQAKIAGREVLKYREMLGGEGVRNARMAVVLPDENLLLPILYSMPEEITDINLTMGYPLRLTSTASFVTLLRMLHLRHGSVEGQPAFYNENVRSLLAHPYSRILIGGVEVERINGYMQMRHRLWITEKEIISIAPEATLVFRTLNKDDGVQEISEYLDKILTTLHDKLDREDKGLIKSRLDKSHINLYRDALFRLRQSVEEHGIKIDYRDVFRLVDRLLSGETVNFEGEPLEGLQVMGTLETRAIDFDFLIIPSANEGLLPRKMRKRSFIPNSLRHGYGMPAANYEESIFAYYFYRMISRARSVTLIYDARSGELKQGEMSRYLQQLLYLYAPGQVSVENHGFMLSTQDKSAEGIVKDESVMKRLNLFHEEGSNKNFSATSLKKYGSCQARFYFETVEELPDNPDPQKYISAVEQGNIVHEMMQSVYLPKELQNRLLETPVVIGKDTIRAILADEERLWRMMTATVNRLHYKYRADELDKPLTGASRMIAGELLGQVKDVLRHDLKLAPFELLGCEVKGVERWPISDGSFVNMKFAIDRIDRLGDGSLRIVDYKTGGAHVDMKEDISEILLGNNADAANAFQLFLYANLLNMHLGQDNPIKMCVYQTSRPSRMEVLPKLAGETVTDYHEPNESFKSLLDEMLLEIFSDKDFSRPEDDSACRFCSLKIVCGR